MLDPMVRNEVKSLTLESQHKVDWGRDLRRILYPNANLGMKLEYRSCRSPDPASRYQSHVRLLLAPTALQNSV